MVFKILLYLHDNLPLEVCDDGPQWWLINFVPTPLISFFLWRFRKCKYIPSHRPHIWIHVPIWWVFGEDIGHNRGRFPSATHVSKSQHRSKVPTCEPQLTTKIWLNIIQVKSWLYYAQIFAQLGLSVGCSFWLNPTRNTSPKPHLQKVLPCRHPCHCWDLGLGTLCEMVSPNFHALNGWDCMDWSLVIWDLVLGTLCEPIPSHNRVFPSPTGYMLWSFIFCLFIWSIFYRFLLNDGWFSKALNLNRLFLKFNWFICNYTRYDT